MQTQSPQTVDWAKARPTTNQHVAISQSQTGQGETTKDTALSNPDESNVDLETVLEAWQTATDRLQKTHELLRQEVSRLSDELEVKNRELERKDRLADLGRMAALVAHEVRNGLMPITLYMSLLRRRLEADPATVDLIDKVQAGFTSLEVTVSDLLSFTTDREPQRESFQLADLLQEVIESLRPQFNAQHIATDVEVDQNFVTHGDRHMLRRLFLNLIINALDVMPNGGSLTIELTRSQEGTGGYQVIVNDTGPGLSTDVVDRLFDPFFTTKSGGTGLGLAIVERVMAAHHGKVYATNREQGGAAIHLIFSDFERKETT